MDERTDFIRKCEEILNFFDIYAVMRHEYFEKFFPDAKTQLKYLLKNRRLHESPCGVYIGTDEEISPDKCMVAALSVLADVLEKVKTHARATPPAQISFVTHSGDFYEIVYAAYGMEAYLNVFLRPETDSSEEIKRMVIIESQQQLTRLLVPGVTRFALIQPNGSLSYFKAGS